MSFIVNAKFNSLKSLFMTLREYTDGKKTYFPHASCRHTLEEYTLRVGSKVMPSKAPASSTEFFCELLKAIGSMSDINHEPMIDMDSYDVKEAVPNTETTTHISSTSSSPSFLIGVDMETYSNSNKDRVFSGYNSSNEDVIFNLTFSGGNTNIRADCYAMYDSILICENGVCSAQF